MAEKPPRPTDAELEILTVLWSRGPTTVREVHEAICARKPTQYTTVLKMLQIMAEKGLVRRDEKQRAHIYQAAQPQEWTQRQLAGDLLQRAFNGARGACCWARCRLERPSQGRTLRTAPAARGIRKGDAMTTALLKLGTLSRRFGAGLDTGPLALGRRAAGPALGAALLVLRSSRARYFAGCAGACSRCSAGSFLTFRIVSWCRRIHAIPRCGSGAIARAPDGARRWVISQTAVSPADYLPWLAPFWFAGVLFFHLRGVASWMAARRLRRRGVCCRDRSGSRGLTAWPRACASRDRSRCSNRAWPKCPW